MTTNEILETLKQKLISEDKVVVMVVGLPSSTRTKLVDRITTECKEFEVISTNEIIDSLTKSSKDNNDITITKAKGILDYRFTHHSDKVLIDMVNLKKTIRTNTLSNFPNFYKIAIQIIYPIDNTIAENNENDPNNIVPPHIMMSLSQQFDIISRNDGEFDLLINLTD